MISYAEALREILALAQVRPLGSTTVPLAACVGRLAASDLVGREPIPPFDNSAMDGFALCAAATAAATDAKPITLQVVGRVAAGDPVWPDVQATTVAIEIMTGAALPGGSLDAVAKIRITVRRACAPGEHVRRRGADFAAGQRVVAAGTRLMPAQILALAAVGVTEVPVRRRPTAALIATGKELVDASTAVLRPGHIRNSTTPFLLAALPLFGASVESAGAVGDDPQRFLDRVAALLARPEPPDLILSTGAVSMGRHDFIPSALERLGATIRLHRVAVQPGRPILVAEWARRPAGPGPVFFGIPGNPVSTAVGLRFFVAPFVRGASGLKPERPNSLPLAANATKTAGLRAFYKARAEMTGGLGLVTALAGQASFMVSPLLEANAWVALPEEPSTIAAGMPVDVFAQYPDAEPAGSPLLPEAVP